MITLHRLRWSFVVTGFFLIGGCGGGVEGVSPVPSQGSLVVNETAPEVGDLGTIPGSKWRWKLDDDSMFVALENLSGGDAYEITVPATVQVLAVAAWREPTPLPALGAWRHLLVSTVNTDGRFALWAFHDSNGDGGPDQNTLSLVIEQPLGGHAYVTSMARSPDGSRVYLLDRRCQDVLVAIDNTGDGLPDVLNATPFAKSEDEDRLLQAESLQVIDVGEVRPLAAFLPASARVGLVSEFPRSVLKDSDGDDVAEGLVTTEHGSDPVFPHSVGRPFDGQDTFLVTGTEGRVAQLWRVDPARQKVMLLGFETVEEGETAINLDPVLSEGQRVGLCYADGNAGQIRVLRVVAVRPQIRDLDVRVASLSGCVIEAVGQNFTLDTNFVLVSGPSDVVTHLTLELVDSRTAKLTVPALTAELKGNARIQAWDPDHPEDVSSKSLPLCGSGGN